jgi:hypothetical protein
MRLLKAIAAAALTASTAVACASPYDDYYGSRYGLYQPTYYPSGYYGSRYGYQAAYYGPQYTAAGPHVTIAASF